MASRSLSELSNPGHQFQRSLHVGRGDHARVFQGSFLQGSLGQVIDEARQTVSGLEKQLQSSWLERIGMDACFLEPRLDITGQLVVGPGLQTQTEAQTS